MNDTDVKKLAQEAVDAAEKAANKTEIVRREAYEANMLAERAHRIAFKALKALNTT